MYNDPVNHPAHYTSGSVECIDAMVSAFGAAQVAVYAKIAAFKYLWRADHKDDTENMVTGRIVYINRQHRYYLAEYPAGRQALREAFKYAEEG